MRIAAGSMRYTAFLLLAAGVAHAQGADEWAERLRLLTTHNQTAFQVGPRLVDIPSDVALQAVRDAWPDIGDDGVKTGLLKAFHFAQHPDVLDVLHLGATDKSQSVREYAFTYLRTFAWRDFVEAPGDYTAWRNTYKGQDVEDVLNANVTNWAKRYLAASETEQDAMRVEVNRLAFLGTPNTKAYRPSVLRYARQAGLPESLLSTDASHERDMERIAERVEVASLDLRAAGDPNMRYFLITGGERPEGGYKLLVVLPGGDGSEDFNPFVERLAQHWLPPGYLVAQLVAPEWSSGQFERLVWPTATNPLEEAEFTTEAFIDAVVDEVNEREQINAGHVYVLGWSSGGPPAYAATLMKDSRVRGAFILASVFKPDFLPDLAGADEKPFFILHSPEDFIPIAMAEKARDELQAHGATTFLETYPDGHGWPRKLDVVARGIAFLERKSR